MINFGDVNQGVKDNPFPWQQARANKLDEFNAFDGLLKDQNQFQQSEISAMSNVWKELKEQGKADFMGGDVKKFKAKYDAEKDKLVGEISKYPSVQAFMSSGGPEKLADFQNNLLNSNEYANGIRNKIDFMAIMNARAKGMQYGLPTDNGTELNDAVKSWMSGETDAIGYRGHYNWNGVDQNRFPTAMAEKDTKYSLQEYARKLDEDPNTPHQLKPTLLKEYAESLKEGNGLYKTLRSPSLDRPRSGQQGNKWIISAANTTADDETKKNELTTMLDNFNKRHKQKYTFQQFYGRNEQQYIKEGENYDEVFFENKDVPENKPFKFPNGKGGFVDMIPVSIRRKKGTDEWMVSGVDPSNKYKPKNIMVPYDEVSRGKLDAIIGQDTKNILDQTFGAGSKGGADQFPLPQGKPANVTQGGHQYTWNTSTGKYE